MVADKIPVQYFIDRLAYDPETGELHWRPRQRGEFSSLAIFRNWSVRFENRPAFCRPNRNGYLSGEMMYHGERFHFLAHRICFAIYNGRFPEHTVDHINGIRTDNRILNLREATRRQQSYNVRSGGGKYLIGTRPEGQKWRSYIFHDGRQVNLGTFNSEEAAHAAYRQKCLDLRGDFAPAEFKGFDR